MSYHLVDAHCAIDLDYAQLQSARLLYHLLREEVVAEEQVRQGALWLACLRRNRPGESPAVERGASEGWGRNKPDRLIRTAQERRDESRQQSEPLGQNQRILRQRQ